MKDINDHNKNLMLTFIDDDSDLYREFSLSIDLTKDDNIVNLIPKVLTFLNSIDLIGDTQYNSIGDFNTFKTRMNIDIDFILYVEGLFSESELLILKSLNPDEQIESMYARFIEDYTGGVANE